MTDQFTYDAAPYVLGALSPEDRLAFEAHLAECPACDSQVREFAGLPGLLSRLPAEDLAAALGERPAPTPPPPPSLLPRLQFAVRRDRRASRWRVVATGLAAACVAAFATTVVIEQTSDGSSGGLPAASSSAAGPTLPFRQIGTVPVTAQARLTAESWGTAIEMRCTYLGQAGEEPRQYTLVAEDRSDNPRPIGDWTVVPGKEVVLRGSTAIPRDQLRSLRVLSPSGRTLLELDL